MYKYIILKLNIFLANIESVIRAHFKTFQIKVAGNILFTLARARTRFAGKFHRLGKMKGLRLLSLPIIACLELR